MKKYLVIGSNSFSGSHFVNMLLNKNFKVYGLSRSIEPASEFLPYKNNSNLKNFMYTKFDLNKEDDILKVQKIIRKNKIKDIINLKIIYIFQHLKFMEIFEGQFMKIHVKDPQHHTQYQD